MLAAQVVVWEDSHAFLLARVVDINADLILQASVDAIALATSQTDGGGTPTTAVPVVNDTVFDTLQDDALWDNHDDLGYNFKHKLKPADVAVGGQTYRAEFKLTDTSNDISHIVFEIKAEALLRS